MISFLCHLWKKSAFFWDVPPKNLWKKSVPLLFSPEKKGQFLQLNATYGIFRTIWWDFSFTSGKNRISPLDSVLIFPEVPYHILCFPLYFRKNQDIDGGYFSTYGIFRAISMSFALTSGKNRTVFPCCCPIFSILSLYCPDLSGSLPHFSRVLS